MLLRKLHGSLIPDTGGRGGEGHRQRPAVLRLALSLWALVFCFYAVTGTGHSSFGDGALLLTAARSLLDRGELAVAAMPEAGSALKGGRDGKWYASFGPGLIAAHLPMLLLGRSLPWPQPVTDVPDRRDEFWGQLTNAWVMAGVVVFIFLCGVALDDRTLPSLAVALMAAIASPLWLYARIDSTEALQALGVVAAFHALLHRRPGIAGLCLAVAVLAKAANAVLVPWFLLYAVVTHSSGGERGAAVIRFSTAVFLGLVLTAAYNYVRFEDPFRTGYYARWILGSAPVGLASLLVLPSNGLLFFWPASLLAIAGTKAFASRHRHETILIAGVFLTLLAVYSPWWAYWGMSWGPRFLVPAVPLLSLLLLPIASRPGRGWKSALLAAAVVGFVVQLVAVASSYWHQVFLVQRNLRFGYPTWIHNDPRIAPLRIGIWWIRSSLAPEPPEPPWSGVYPWKNPAVARSDVREMRGLDLWVLPESWRMPYRAITRAPLDGSPTPSSAALALVLIGAGGVAGLSLANEARRLSKLASE